MSYKRVSPKTMGKFQDHVEQKMPDVLEHIMHASICMKF